MNVSKKEHLLTQPEPGRFSRRWAKAPFVIAALLLVLFVFSLLDWGQIAKGFEALDHWQHTRDYWRFIEWFGKAFWIFLVPAWLLFVVVLVLLGELLQKLKGK